jgi:putative glutamine amidotransferase
MPSPATLIQPAPVVAITTDYVDDGEKPRAQVRANYFRAVHEAGGVPVLLPAVKESAAAHARLFDAYVFIGGDDLSFEPFGKPTHPKAQTMNPVRQAYETALLDALRDSRPRAPVLGVCLGMQLISMHAGGEMDQYLPEHFAGAERHRHDRVHDVTLSHASAGRFGLSAGAVTSSHKQGVTAPGGLTVLAHSDDGLIEAVADLERPFYLGVQWHPERTNNRMLGARVFEALVAAARTRS